MKRQGDEDLGSKAQSFVLGVWVFEAVGVGRRRRVQELI